MKPLRKNPHLYEINLMPWLNHLGQKAQHKITLENIPAGIWSRLKTKGMDLIWLMGMWNRSADSRQRARKEPNLVKNCQSILEDFKAGDISGSPYAIDSYLPDPAFGTRQDLLFLKRRFTDMGLSLILDFVPNHTACDHPWISQNPEYYVQAGPTKKRRVSQGVFPGKKRVRKAVHCPRQGPFFLSLDRYGPDQLQ